MKQRPSTFWTQFLLIVAVVSVPVFSVWIGIELSLAASTTDRNEILFRKEIILAVIQGATLLYLAFTLAKNWEMASAARDAAEASRATLEEMRDARDDETAPYVVVHFDIPHGKQLLYLVIKNIGKSVATDVQITFDPILSDTRGKKFSAFPIFTDGIKTLPPDYEIKTLVDVSFEFYNSNLPKSYTVTVSYSGGMSDKRRSGEYILDIMMYSNLTMSFEKDIGDVVKQIERVAKELSRQTGVLNDISTALEGDEKEDDFVIKSSPLLQFVEDTSADTPDASTESPADDKSPEAQN